MHKRDIVVAGNNVAERRETLLDTLDDNAVGESVANVLELLVGRAGRHKEAIAVSACQTANDTDGADGRVDDGDAIGKLALKDTVEQEQTNFHS